LSLRRRDSPESSPVSPPGLGPPVDVYDPGYVRRLFDEMSDSYERTNLITSFGFSRRWRAQAVDRLVLRPGMAVHDWMTGIGEGWGPIVARIGPAGRIVAVDLSAGMLRHARRRLDRRPSWLVEIVEGDLLGLGLPASSADAILCLFGVKTLSGPDLARFAAELARVLRPGGTYSIVEVSVPRWPPLRIAYLFYLKRVIPLLGRLLLGNPENYRMLGVYTEQFGNCEALTVLLRETGLQATFVESFFGCATGVRGERPPG
jgi:demethylmenaquinone methyltransferase/2-methoxy-6-polyprenyl-1,4-benzoquinol methylase